MTASVMTVSSALRLAKASGVDRLDAQLLLSHVLGRSRTWLIAHDDAELELPPAQAFQAALARRAAGEPIAYLLGKKDFHGLTFEVNESVLVPRPDTEVLVDWALELLAGELSRISHPRVVDLGTGSGAIALAVKHARPLARVHATDLDAKALDVARMNAVRLQLEVTFSQGAWWNAIENGRFDLVLSNPPYIAAEDPHLAALVHEPQLALTPGGDGLGALRTIVAASGPHLEPGGWLLLEHGFDQADAVRDLLQSAGFERVQTRADLGGQPRCSGGRT